MSINPEDISNRLAENMAQNLISRDVDRDTIYAEISDRIAEELNQNIIAAPGEDRFQDIIASRVASSFVAERSKGNTGIEGLKTKTNKTDTRKKVSPDSIYKETSTGKHTIEHALSEGEAKRYLQEHPETEYKLSDLVKPESKQTERMHGQTSNPHVTPEMDTEYMKHAEAGNHAEAAKMLDHVAKKHGFIGPVYHGTNDDSFDANSFNTENMAWFSTSPQFTKSWGKRTIPSYIRLDNPKKFENAGLHMAELDRKGAANAIRKKGMDGVVITNPNYTDLPTNYAVAYPHQARSADPVVKDKDGKIVPLSERFPIIPNHR